MASSTKIRCLHQIAGGMEPDSRQPGGNHSPESRRLSRGDRHQSVRDRTRVAGSGNPQPDPSQNASDGAGSRRSDRGDFLLSGCGRSQPFRKPNPGMLLEIGRRLKCNLQGAPVVGDSVRDIRAARAANAWPCWCAHRQRRPDPGTGSGKLRQRAGVRRSGHGGRVSDD